MACDTRVSLRNSIIYSVFVRNHTQKGTFRALISDLPRIRALGADIIWLLPVHPIGKLGRKGSLGCPYSISDYRAVNPEYGSLNDFLSLADAVHKNGMKLMIDVVFNHTAKDSVLLREHPEWFYKNAGNKPESRVPDWTDVADLDYTNKELWDYQIKTLKEWAKIVDGFRCDVAPLVPLDFWKEARDACAEVNPGLIWLAETGEPSFYAFCESIGIKCEKDGELFGVFDAEYDYDAHFAVESFLRKEGSLGAYINLLNLQEAAYPENYVKLRFLENHDRPRISSLVKEPQRLKTLTAMLFFLKGATLIYAGQEYCLSRAPSLFDLDRVDFSSGRDESPYFSRLAAVKREVLSQNDSFYASFDEERGIAVLTRDDGKRRKIGVFPLNMRGGRVFVNAPDGKYENIISEGGVTVSGGKAECGEKPLIFSFEI